MTLRLSRLRLGNFKCFREQSFELGGLTLLAGINGTGKTTLIQALLALRQSSTQGLLETGRLALNGDLVRIGSGRDALYEAADREIISLTLGWSDGHELEWQFECESTARILAQKNDGRFDDSEREPFSENFYYLSADRTAPQTFFPISDQTVGGPHHLGVQGQFTLHFLSILRNQSIPCPELVHPNEPSDALLRQVEAWLGTLRPGLRLTVQQHDAIDVVQLGFQFLIDQQLGGTYRPTNVGFGLTYTLPVLVALLSMPPGGLVIVENPEAHLHPRGQSQLGELCARAAAAGVQVIVETHSDHVLNGIRIAVREGKLPREDVAVHFFTLDEAGLEPSVLSPRIDSHGKLDTWPDGFFDEWDRALDKLLD